MIFQTRMGDRELRMFEASALIPRPGSRMALSTTVLRAQELGVAAVACAVQLVSESLGIPVMRVFEGDASERRPVLDAPQAELFQDPSEGETSFDLWCDTSVSLELERNAFLWKTKTKQDGVLELIPVDPRYFQVSKAKANAPKVIKARVDGVEKDVTANVVHIRSWAPVAGASEGVGKLELHQGMLRTAMSLELYRGRWFDNDGTPGIVLDAGGTTPTRAQRQELLEDWMKLNSGPENAGKPGLIWGSVKAIHKMGASLQEAQAAELDQVVALQVARAWRIFPAELLHAATAGRMTPNAAEVWSDMFVRFSLLPRMRRIERAISADREVFPDRRRYARFDVDELLRGDIGTLATMIHQLVQVGVITKNEGRAKIGLPRIDGGDELQETPVGGAPNAPAASDQPADAG